MSLINQMLRDLEQRQVASSTGPQLVMGQVSVSRGNPRHRWRLIVGALGATMLTAAGAAWYYSDRQAGPVIDGSVQADPMTQALAASAVAQSLPAEPMVGMEPIRQQTAAEPDLADVESTPAQFVRLEQEQIQELAVAEEPNPKQDVPRPVATKRLIPEPEQARLAYQAAKQMLQQGRTEAAISKLRQSLRLQPNWREPRTLLATVHLNHGQDSQAQALLTEGLGKQPNHEAWAIMQARLLLRRQQKTQAIAVLERARRAGANALDLDVFLAALYQRDRRHQEAVAMYQNALVRQPNHDKAWLGLAISLEGLGQPRDALAAYREALRLGGHEESVRTYIEQRISDLGA